MPKTNLPTVSELLAVSSCEYAEGLSRQQFIDPVIRQLWSPMPRIAGPAFTVKCGVGDHLSLHAAIYRAKPGDVIVVQADPDFASAGGNVCAVAQKRGIVAIIADEDGIAVIPKDRLNEVYALAKTRTEKDAEMNLIEWEAQHSKKIESKLKELGFSD